MFLLHFQLIWTSLQYLQLYDSVDGGYLAFERNDYPLDEGLYSEVYCALFSTSSPEWWGDAAFDNGSYTVSSKTENALKTYNSNDENSLNQVKRAVKDDMQRFQDKNTQVIVEGIFLLVYSDGSLGIKIQLGGNTEAFNYIYQKTEQSLENVPFKEIQIWHLMNYMINL